MAADPILFPHYRVQFCKSPKVAIGKKEKRITSTKEEEKNTVAVACTLILRVRFPASSNIIITSRRTNIVPSSKPP